MPDFPYPLDVALQRFYTGETRRHATLLHFGSDPVTTDLPGWFHRYNARQTIEAGIKEGKGVFEMHHLKVRSALGLYLQEQFAVFAANFVRWAAHRLATQCPQLPAGWRDTTQPKVKEQVKVAQIRVTGKERLGGRGRWGKRSHLWLPLRIPSQAKAHRLSLTPP